MASAEDIQVTCKFVTRLPEKYRISPTPFAVPGKLTRYGLSEVINHLLDLDPAKPFDFLVDGELVRTSLEKLLIRKGISAESVLDVEYIPAVGPPSDEATGKHEDWVSAVDGSWAGAVATGCYDGTARLWTPGGKLMCSLSGHEGAVTTVSLLPPPSSTLDGGSGGCTVVAGGHDGTVRTWDVAVKSGGKASEGECCVFAGHEGAVNCVSASPGGAAFATASQDCTARVWSRLGGTVDDRGAAAAGGGSVKKGKRRKGEDGSASAAAAIEGETPPLLQPLGDEVVLSGHKDSVSAVAWETAETVWSGSFDHTLKCWDAESARLSQSFDTPKAVAAVAVKAGGGRVAWCGGGDRLVHMWDPRVGQTTGATTSFASHTEMVVCVRWCPGSDHQFASCAYDGTLKLWDNRGKLPLHTVKAHEKERAMGVDFHGPSRIVSGGTDGRLRIFAIHDGAEE